MVKEKWKLEDANSFADEYKITLQIDEEESEEEEGTVIYQNRPAGDPIINGVTLRIKVAIPKKEVKDESNDPLKDIIPNNGTNNNSNENNNQTN